MRVVGLVIRDLERVDAERPYWKARVVNGDLSVGVHRRFGSWQTDDGRAVMPNVAEMLQGDVKRIERAESRAATPPEAA